MGMRTRATAALGLAALILSAGLAVADEKDTPVSWKTPVIDHGLKDLVTGKRFWSHGKSEPGSEKPPRRYGFEASRAPGGKVSFTPREIDDQSGIGTQFVVLDFNGDGVLDVVTANKKGVFLFLQSRAAG